MPNSGLIRNWASASISIPSGSSLSGSLFIGGRPIIGIMAPVAWTAASICFDVQACPGGTFFPLYDDSGTQVTIPMSASRAIANESKLEKLSAFAGFRIRSGCGVASVVDQGAARTFAIFYQG